jgi:hypothetical protein
MNTYRIERAGTRYQVVEEIPDKGTFEMVGFPTEGDARVWLGDYRRITGQIEHPRDGEPLTQLIG